MIKISNNDKKIVLVCKGHLQDKYPGKSTWVKTFEPLWTEQYGWDPHDHNNYGDYVNGLFFRLYEIHKKIKLDNSGTDMQMRDLFSAIFYPRLSNEAESPVERGINDLCGTIQGTQVRENVGGVFVDRLNLDLE